MAAVDPILASAQLAPAVRPGDTVGVCAPAGPCSPDRLTPGVALLGAHLRLRLGPIAQRLVDGGDRGAIPPYLAGTDAERAAELTGLLRDPDVRAIVMARGGYGLTRILPLLDPADLRRDPKPILGFSDGTALLAWALRAGVRPLHGPVLVQLPNLPIDDLRAMVDALTGAALQPITGLRCDRADIVRGPLVAANAKVLAQLIGTSLAMPTAGALLALEDVGEKPYAIDRNFTQLAQAGVLGGLAGALVGDFTRCTDPAPAPGAADDPREALATVGERLTASGVPHGFGLPIGHGDRNLTLPCGAMAEFDGERGTLTFAEPATQR